MDSLFAVQYSWLIPLLPLIGAAVAGFFLNPASVAEGPSATLVIDGNSTAFVVSGVW